MAHRVEFTTLARRHLLALRATERATVLEAVSRHLSHQPAFEAGKRKRLRENDLAEYRLRVGSKLRVYYDVLDAEQLVLVKAVAVKNRGCMFADGEELKL